MFEQRTVSMNGYIPPNARPEQIDDSQEPLNLAEQYLDTAAKVEEIMTSLPKSGLSVMAEQKLEQAIYELNRSAELAKK